MGREVVPGGLLPTVTNLLIWLMSRGGRGRIDASARAGLGLNTRNLGISKILLGLLGLL